MISANQWLVGDGLYFVVYKVVIQHIVDEQIEKLIKASGEIPITDSNYRWELISFCQNDKEKMVSEKMKKHVELLEPYE